MVVRIEPFYQFLVTLLARCLAIKGCKTHQAGNIDVLLLVATAHSEILVDGLEAVLRIAFRDSLLSCLAAVKMYMTSFRSYIEELDVVEDMVIVGEVVAWDDIDTCIFLDLPVCCT